MNVRYRVGLNQTERDHLNGLLSGGKHAARRLKRAQILLAADAGASDESIALAVGGSTVYRTKRRFVEGNLEAALSEAPRPGAARKLTGREETLLVATVCSSPPKGYLENYVPGGLRLEIIQPTKDACWLSMQGMMAVARSWDGRDPVRSPAALAQDLAGLGAAGSWGADGNIGVR